jgi:molybdopterin-guanine dinucleotide biosynthesis protein A
MRVGGVVLCGGRSSRMGRPKAWLPLGGEVMLQRVVRVLREAVDPVVVVAAPGQDVPPLPVEVEIVRDEVEGRGPLQGLATGLAALDGKADAAYLSACDAPYLTPAFVRRVVELLEKPRDSCPGALAAVPRAGGFLHPLAAAYRLSILPEVRARLATDRLSLTQLFDAVPTRAIEPHELADVGPDLRALRAVNTPDEYARAVLELTGSPCSPKPCSLKET